MAINLSVFNEFLPPTTTDRDRYTRQVRLRIHEVALNVKELAAACDALYSNPDNPKTQYDARAAIEESLVLNGLLRTLSRAESVKANATQLRWALDIIRDRRSLLARLAEAEAH